MRDDAPLLEAKNISLARLWAGVSFALRGGEMLHITGKNGAGKTSMLKILCGLAAPDGGEVLWRQKNIRRAAEEYCADLAYIGHKDGVKDDCTPLENLRFAAAMQCADAALAPAEALEKIGLLETGKLCRQLSAGQKRRTALARLLISRARLWFLDEPLSALDDSARQILGEIAAAHLAGGGGIVVATHQETDWAGAAKTLRLGR
ncbi:MAG: cytochrome c biogenesis heme-transporting ATPase CcmA [Betaproteobacteria bacterium]|nr:cytochrome c biogenesis heme-transporting ATPase CcmA [Betaproteobacteria bacterium]